jgi:hypothetical protein
MAYKYIKIRVSDHPTRCIDEDGDRCPWLATRRLGMTWLCKLYPEKRLREENGCLVKHNACLRGELS